MARGWESKAVEAQQDDARRGPTSAAAPGEDPALVCRRRTLALARTRAVADLERATRTAHRQMLQQAIAALDEQIAALDGAGNRA